MVRELKHTEIGDIPVDWEFQTFEETFKILSNNTLSRDNLNNRGGAVRNIHYGDILTQFSEVLKCSEVEIPYINDLSLLSSSTQLLQDGDLIIADTAEDETVGRVTEVQCLGDEKLVAGLHTIPCRVKKGDFAPGWLGYYMNSHMYHDQIIPFITGIKVSSILKSAIAETLIVIPPVDEQKQIVKILSQMDILIQKEKKVAEKIMAVKNGCLSKMFPRDGECVPEMRLPGFCGAWEQRKVSELFRVTRGYVLAATQTEPTKTDEKPYPVYSSQTKDKGLMGYYKDYLYEDAITWTTDGANAGTVNYRAGKFYCTNVCGVLLSNEVKANQMIAEALNSVAKGYVSYVGNPKLMNNVMADIVIQIPTQAEEREQLSSFFSNLDHLITLHQRKCEKYIGIKSALISTLISAKKQT